MDGFLNILKPPGMSSGDVVAYVRGRLPRGVRTGHAGTLDPDACGVLPVCVGNAVRLFDYIIDKEKTYLAEITLGVVTDTQDSSGRVVSRGDASCCGAKELEAALPTFTGRILQTPPAYSAVHKDGKRLYALARSGADTTVEQREAQIHSLSFVGQTGPQTYLLRIRCGKGVYIRTLLHDIGQALGCGAHMSMLIREEAGAFRIGDAILPESLTRESLPGLLLPIDTPLGPYPRVEISQAHMHFVRNGNRILPEWMGSTETLREGTVVRAYLGGMFAGMGEICADGAMRFRAMLWREP